MTQTAETATPGLPDDVEGLRALLLATLAERDELVTQNDRLRHLLLKLKRLQFGPKSERLPEEQMQLARTSSRRSPAAKRKRRSAILNCAAIAWPIGASTAARCLRIYRGLRSRWSPRTRPARAVEQ